ncbi:DNA polymerase beta superfamily protein [Micromonospora violae]|uniref:DNA polymerase beta superfamily protein n=1 Tax=Micromonospora violae TaxID=1278207 RepID=UPI0033E4497E
MHEARKFTVLCIGGNPTAFELLWLPDDLYEVRTELGQELVDLRSAILSAPRVRDAYLGYACQQFHRLKERGDGSFSADLRKRTAKHARHLARLAWLASKSPLPERPDSAPIEAWLRRVRGARWDRR